MDVHHLNAPMWLHKCSTGNLCSHAIYSDIVQISNKAS